MLGYCINYGFGEYVMRNTGERGQELTRPRLSPVAMRPVLKPRPKILALRPIDP